MVRFTMIAGAAILLGACNGSEAEQAVPDEAAVQRLMEQTVQPQAEIFWNSAGTIIDETGEHDLAPTTDEGWERTRQAAANIADSARLLMTPTYADGRGEDWMQFSQSLVEIAQRAEQAAANQDVDAVFEIGGTMYNVCTACHQVYISEDVPPAAGAEQAS
ncbi:hypothetical protein [Altericroceibacterium xinjiangense]|uniref:hypothetical protein n=1 Tax=Altericroceibacterium xinjiangense TaxID=762261 RepID=UPI000F7EE0F9|nr:hypothetical protein [Altericroceibacterium xinjiangense]